MALELGRDFERFDGGPVLATQQRLLISLSSAGLIYFNQICYAALGKPGSVLLYYSRQKETIAIEPADPNDPKSFPVRQHGKGWRIPSGPFLGHFSIRTKKSIRFSDPDINKKGVLLLDLRRTVNVTSRRSKPAK